MAFSAPDMTAVSKPKRKPPNATTSDHAMTKFFFMKFILGFYTTKKKKYMPFDVKFQFKYIHIFKLQHF
ncbi:hypothetical protein D3C87_1593330 [compost metagenome]